MAAIAVALMVAQISSASQSKNCNLCKSFMDAKPAALSDMASSLVGGDCSSACVKLDSGKNMMDCAVLCDQMGTASFNELVSSNSCDGFCGGAVSFLETAAMTGNASKAKPGNVTINGDMTVTGSLKAKAIRSTALIVNGSMTVTHSVRAEFLKVENAKASVVESSTISSSTGTVQLTGNLGVSKGAGGSGGSLQAESLHTDNLIQLGQKQWSLLHHDSFEEDHNEWSTGSSFIQVSDVNGDKFMGGHCNFAGGAVKKTYQLPEHTHLRVQARAHFIDSWEGETAFLQVDNEQVWAHSVDSRGSKGMNIAGGAHPEHKWGEMVDVVVPHTEPTVLLAFGNTLDEHACDESFGVDDVMLHIL
jgi:hypothetical protein